MSVRGHSKKNNTTHYQLSIINYPLSVINYPLFSVFYKKGKSIDVHLQRFSEMI